MEKTLVFTHRLGLALRLVDTTSGRNVPGRDALIFIDGKQTRFGEKGDHLLIFQNLEKRSFQLEIKSFAFERLELSVNLDALDKTLPLLELHLVPSANYPGRTEFLTVEGTLPGIGELSAARLGDNACLMREFDSRKRMAKIFNPHHLALDRVQYALVDPDQNFYESFRILRLVDSQTLKVDRILEMPFKNYFPITPLISGLTRPDGSYCLRMRDDAENARWLIRWTEEGTANFRVIDFRDTPHPRLEEGGG